MQFGLQSLSNMIIPALFLPDAEQFNKLSFEACNRIDSTV